MKLQGTVKTQKGETLPGANIYISDALGKPKAEFVGVQSDINGEFTLFGIDNLLKDHVTVSFVGYKTITVSLKDIDQEVKPLNIEVIGSLGSEYDPLVIPFNPVLVSETETLPEFSVVAKKPKWWLYILIALSSIFLISFALKKLK